MWEYPDHRFLPHGINGEPTSVNAPVVIDHREPESGADQLLINLAAAIPPFFGRFERVAEIIVQSRAKTDVIATNTIATEAILFSSRDRSFRRPLMKRPTPSTRDSEAQNSLLGDLESIRTLLDRPRRTRSRREDSDDVPMLEDMVEGAFTVNESVLDQPASFDDSVAIGDEATRGKACADSESPSEPGAEEGIAVACVDIPEDLVIGAVFLDNVNDVFDERGLSHALRDYAGRLVGPGGQHCCGEPCVTHIQQRNGRHVRKGISGGDGDDGNGSEEVLGIELHFLPGLEQFARTDSLDICHADRFPRFIHNHGARNQPTGMRPTTADSFSLGSN